MSDKNQTQLTTTKQLGYKATDVYIEKYYKFPSFLIQNERYNQMKDTSKIAYMLFKNEFRRAIHEKWIDENGIMYFEFTQADLMNKLNCYQGKVNSTLKELESFGLICIIKGEFNPKTKKNEKNKYYLLQPEITADDLFIQNLENSFMTDEKIQNSELTRDAKIARRQENAQSLDKSGYAEIAHRQENAESLDKSGYAEIAQDYYINNLDTNRHLKDTETDDLQNQLLLDGFVDLMNDSSISTFVPDKCLNLIAKFSETFEQAQATVKTIHNAKYKAEQETGNTMVYEVAQDNWDVDTKLYTTLLKVYQKQKTEKVNNLQNLIFIYVKNLFVEQIAPSINPKNSSLPSVNTANWLEK